MPDTDFNAALRQKIRSPGQGAAGTVLRPDLAGPGFVRALRRAGEPYTALRPEPVAEDPIWDSPLQETLKLFPENRLSVVLEGNDGERGLCVLENLAVDALVEVRTTGKVDSANGLTRPPTQIDAALTRDFIGLLLSAFAAELSGAKGVNWAIGLTYGAHVVDPAQLDLLLSDQPYHLFQAKVGFGGGIKAGRIWLMVPVTGPGAVDNDTPSDRPADLGPQWESAVMNARVDLDAVLIRKTLTLAEMEGLTEGDILPLDPADLANVTLCDARGQATLSARLGRNGGSRAVCLNDNPGLAKAKVAGLDGPDLSAMPAEPAAPLPKDINPLQTAPPPL